MLIGVNAFITIILFLIIELIFGNWFTTKPIQNLNILKNISQKVDVTPFYSNQNQYITYTRDEFGLRGTSCSNPNKISILTVGGSTTDQRYIDDKETWQALLEDKFKQDKTPQTFGNAGLDGHSTYAHVKSFYQWFPLIPNLKPKWIIFYVGINDFYIWDNHERDNLNTNWKEKSVLYQTYTKIKRWKNARAFKLIHHKIDLNKVVYTNQGLLNLEEIKPLTMLHNAAYQNRIIQLINLCKAQGAQPIFITQPCMFYQIKSTEIVGTKEPLVYSKPINGVDYYYIKQQLDSTLIKTCINAKVRYINIGNDTDWSTTDFYDYVHLNPIGTHKLANKIFKQLQPIITSSENGN